MDNNYLEALKLLDLIYHSHEDKGEAKKKALGFIEGECREFWLLKEPMLAKLRKIPTNWGQPFQPATIQIQLYAMDEDETPEESEVSTGSASGYAEAVEAVMRKAVGKWGWCVATVEVTLKDAEGKTGGRGYASLGNCSYQSAEDFRKSGYLPQMISEAIDDAYESRPGDTTRKKSK